MQEQAEDGTRALAEAVRKHAASEQALQLQRDQLAAEVRLACNASSVPCDSHAKWRWRW